MDGGRLRLALLRTAADYDWPLLMGRPRHAAPIVPAATKVTSRRHARKVTSAYHKLTAQIKQAQSAEERAAATAELEQMGGVIAYQQASALNTALNSTSRWVVQALRQRGLLPQREGRLRVLEVGAINTQLLDEPQLKTRAIDLHSINSRIEQCDFLSLPHGGEVDPTSGASRPYDAVVCSMVLNCVPEPRRRFDMLVGLRAQLDARGVCFVTVPRTCLKHSFTVTHESFCDSLRAVGLVPVAYGKASEKVAFFECEAAAPDAAAALRFQQARHERRRAQRARAAGAKSRGAHFDIDLGGYLGLGVRVARSFEGNTGARLAKEQALVRGELLARCRREDELAVAAAAASAGRTGGDATASVARHSRGELLSNEQLRGLRDGGASAASPSAAAASAAASAACAARSAVTTTTAPAPAADDDEAGGSQLEEREERRLQEGDEWGRVAQLLDAKPPAQLDFANWRWYPGSSHHGGWSHVRPGDSAPDGAVQQTSGWQWGASGWSYAEPPQLALEARGAAAPAAKPPRSRVWFRAAPARMLPPGFRDPTAGWWGPA